MNLGGRSAADAGHKGVPRRIYRLCVVKSILCDIGNIDERRVFMRLEGDFEIKITGVRKS